MTDSITHRQNKEKTLILEKLKTTPIVQIVCEKTGVSRATFYRWRKDDQEFASAAEEAIHAGESLVNDLAESQLISAIRNQNMTAIIFWLKSHHPAYANKVEVTGQLKHDYQLTVDEEALIAKALSMVAHQGGDKS